MLSLRIPARLQPGLAAVALTLATTSVASAAPTTALNPTCSHPYFPVSETAEWHYRAGMPALPILMGEDVVRNTNLATDTFDTERRVADAGTIVRTWVCTPDGLSDMARSGSVRADDAPQAEGTLQNDAASGITLPRPELWQPGYSWVQTANTTFDGPDVVPGTNPRAAASVARTHTIVGQEQVTVPAGSFTAWRVDTTASGPVTVTIGGQTQTFDVTNTQTAWYTENVGLVKSTFSTDDMVVDTMELISYQP